MPKYVLTTNFYKIDQKKPSYILQTYNNKEQTFLFKRTIIMV